MPRRIGARVLLGVLSPFPLLFFAAAFAEARSTAPFLFVAALMGVPMAYGFAREHTYRLWVGDDGLELRALGLLGMKTTTLRFAEIDKVFISAVDPSAGGGVAVQLAAMAIDKATKPKDGGYNEHTTSLTVTIMGAGKKLTLNNGTKGVTQVYRAVVDATSACLRDDVEKRLVRGDKIAFGPYQLEADGVRSWGALVPWQEIKDFVVEGGALRLKKEGAWLSKSSTPTKNIPNLDVLLAVVAAKRGLPA